MIPYGYQLSSIAGQLEVSAQAVSSGRTDNLVQEKILAEASLSFPATGVLGGFGRTATATYTTARTCYRIIVVVRQHDFMGWLTSTRVSLCRTILLARHQLSGLLISPPVRRLSERQQLFACNITCGLVRSLCYFISLLNILYLLATFSCTMFVCLRRNTFPSLYIGLSMQVIYRV